MAALAVGADLCLLHACQHQEEELIHSFKASKASLTGCSEQVQNAVRT